MGEFIDMVGQKFGKITVVKLDHMHPKNGAYWECLCDCGSGKEFLVSGKNIRQGKVLSCGCLVKECALMRRDNLLDKKFGMLTVFSFVEKQHGGISWLCTCDCGNDKIVSASGCDLKKGKTKSCGCFRRKRLAFGENAFNRLYHTYKKKAWKKNFEFDFTKKEFKEITKKNCFYCGIEPKQSAGPTIKGFGYYLYNGIDRLNNSIGYTKENSVPCCGQCNVAKNDYSKDSFFDWIKRVNNNLFGDEK